MAAGDEDSVLSRRDPLPDVKKQVPPVTATTRQADQPQHAPIEVPPGQPSGTSSVRTTAMQADLPQHSPIVSKTDERQQMKDTSHQDHLQVPKEAPGAQQSTA